MRFFPMLITVGVVATATISSSVHAVEVCEANILHNTPHRRVRDWKVVSGDLSTYRPFVFHSDMTEKCSMAITPEEDVCLDEDLVFFLENPLVHIETGLYLDDDENITNYFDSVINYVLFAMALFALTFCGGLIFGLARCGRRCWPNQDRVYPYWHTVATYGLLLGFIVTVSTLVGLGHFKGSVGLTECQYALADSPGNAATVLQGAVLPLKVSMVSLMSDTLPTSFKSFNTTITSSVNLTAGRNSIECITEIVSIATNDVKTQVMNVTTSVREALAELPSLDLAIAAVDELEANATTLLGMSDTVGTDVDAISTHLSSTQTALNKTDSLVTTFTEEVTTLSSTMATVRDHAQALVDARASVAITKSILTNLTTNTPYTTSEIDRLDTNLSTSLTALSASSPDALATSLSSANTTMNDMTVSVDSLLAQLDILEGLLANTTAAQALYTTLNEIIVYAETSISMDDILNIADELGESVATFLDGPTAMLDIVVATLDRITLLLPCSLDLAPFLLNMDANVFELPFNVSELSETMDGLTGTINDAVDQIMSFKNDITSGDMLPTDALKNLTSQINGTAQDVQAQLETIITEAQSAVTDLDIGLANLNSTSTVNGLQDELTYLRGNLTTSSLRPTSQEIIDLRAAETIKDTALNSLTDLQAIMADLKTLANNFPNEDFYCLPSSGVQCYDYSMDGGVLLPLKHASTTCAEKEPDSEGCAFPYEPMLAAIESISAFETQMDSVGIDLQADVIDGTSSMDSSAGDVDTSACCATQLTDLTTMRTDLTAARDAMGNKASGLSGNSTVDARQAVNSVIENNSTVTELLDDLDTQIRDQFGDDLSDMVPDNLDELSDMLINAIDFFLKPSGLQRQLDSFTELVGRTSAPTHSGDEPSSTFFVESVNLIDGAITNLFATFNVSSSNGTALGSITNSTTITMLDSVIAYDQETSSGGPIYFFSKVLDAMSGSGETSQYVAEADLVGKDSPQVFGYGSNAENTYGNDQMCVTTECLRNTIDKLNAQPLSIGDMSMPLSREQITTLPYLIPLFALIMALGIPCSKRCGNLLTCYSACLSPFIFLVAGGLVFPMTIVPSDVCVSAEGLMANHVEAISPMICERLGGVATSASTGEYGMDMCEMGLFEATAAHSGKVSLNISSLLTASILTCDPGSRYGQGNSDLEDLVDEIDHTLNTYVNTMLNSAMSGPDLGLRPQVVAVINETAALISKDLTTLVRGLIEAVECDKLHSAYAGFKDTLCCDCVSAMYWFASTWYVMGWSLLLCGCPVGYLSVSRIHTRALGSKRQAVHAGGGIRYKGVRTTDDSMADKSQQQMAGRGRGALGSRGRGRGGPGGPRSPTRSIVVHHYRREGQRPSAAYTMPIHGVVNVDGRRGGPMM